MINLLIPALLFLVGAAIGSFLNVCIARIPENKSIISPPSHCPVCKKPIIFYDNIPLLSYIVLNGRCRTCRTPIPFYYFFIELLTPLITLVLYGYFDLSIPFLLACLFTYALIVITIIDYHHKIIPNVISLPGIPIGLLCSLFVPWTDIQSSLIGLIAGGGILYLVAKGYYLVRKEEGMGAGDVKLLAMIGAFLGWKGALISLMLGAFIGTIVGITMMLCQGKNVKYAIPFGPFLSIGAFCALVWGDTLVSWYLSLGQ